jgi:hypothetical protein
MFLDKLFFCNNSFFSGLGSSYNWDSSKDSSVVSSSVDMGKDVGSNMGTYMYSFGVSGWYGVGMSNWSVYKRVGICMYWGMSVSMSIWKSSIGYYWCLYFDWFWSLNLDGLYGWEGIGQRWEGVVSICSWKGVVSIYSWSGNGNSSLTNRIDESILVNIFRETFEVKGAGTTWGGYKISPCWSERSCWESRLKKLWVGCWGGRSYGGNGQNDKCLHCDIKMLRRN